MKQPTSNSGEPARLATKGKMFSVSLSPPHRPISMMSVRPAIDRSMFAWNFDGTSHVEYRESIHPLTP